MSANRYYYSYGRLLLNEDFKSDHPTADWEEQNKNMLFPIDNRTPLGKIPFIIVQGGFHLNYWYPTKVEKQAMNYEQEKRFFNFEIALLEDEPLESDAIKTLKNKVKEFISFLVDKGEHFYLEWYPKSKNLGIKHS